MKRLMSILLIVCLLVSACSPVATPQPENSSDPGSTTPVTSDAPPAASTIKRGGTMVVRRTGVTPINPAQTIAPAGDSILYDLFFETLTWLDEADFTAQPNLAESWEYSADSLQLDMKLVEGAMFFDGSPVNAEAVKATFEFYLDPNEPHKQQSYISRVSNIEVVSEYVVRFNFSEPDSGFLNALTQPIGIVLSPASIEKYKATGDVEVFAREGGCGPFILEQLLDGESYTAKKNPNYYRMGEDGQPLPYLDGVVVQIIGDEAVMAANFQSGDVDVLDFFQGMSYINAFAQDSNVTLYELANVIQYILYMNTTKAPFDNRLVREALCYAFDRQDLINTMNGGNGFTTPTIVIPSQTYYRAESKIYNYDPAKAKDLLAQAGYADGVTIELYYGTYGVLQQMCELLQSQAKDAGFNIELVALDGATVKQVWASYNEEAPAGIRINDLGHPKASPYVQMEYTFGPEALQNCSKWFDPTFINLLNDVRTQTDQAERDATLVEMQRMIDEYIPIVTLHTASRYSAFRNWVKGLRYNGDGTMLFTEAWLDK